MLYEDVVLNCYVVKDIVVIFYEYQLYDELVVLQVGCMLMIGVCYFFVEDMLKYYVVCKWGKRKGLVGGIYENGWMKIFICELGIYIVVIDILFL